MSVDPQAAPGTTGELLAGRYRLLNEPLGEGSAGRVVAAHDELLDRRVAVKLLDRVTDELGVRRALRAARAAAQVDHPGVLRILDIQEGTPAFLVLQAADARPLSAELQRGWLPADRAQRIGDDLVDAVAALHAAGAVHRDLRPENILVTPGGGTLITSAGIAEAALDPGLGERLAGESPRPPEAPSPEQALSLATDARSDVFALGLLLLALPEAAPGPRVTGVLGRAMAEDPADRQADAGVLRDELRAGGGPSAADTARVPAFVPAPAPAPRPWPTAAAEDEPLLRRVPLLVWLVVAAALAFAVFFAVRAVLSPDREPLAVPASATSSPPAESPPPSPPGTPLSALAPLVAEGRGRPDLGAQTQALVERVAALEGFTGSARAAEAADLYGLAAVDGSSGSASAGFSDRVAVALQPELSLEGLIALVERDPAQTGPASAAFAEELRDLAALPLDEQVDAATPLFVRALVETERGGFSPTFGRTVTDLLQRLPSKGS